jgi:uroporphyrinogen-III synthase
MKNIEQLIEPLNLVYYEYDKSSKSFVLDKNHSNKHIFEELITLTYTLSKHHVDFIVDKNKTLLLGAENSFSAKLKRYSSSLIQNIKNSCQNIYVLNDKKVKWAKNLPVFKIETIKQEIDFSKYDALIFTSKNGVKSIDSYDKKWKKTPAYVIAPQTAKVVNDLGGKVKFVGKKKHGNEFAHELIEELKGKKVLYLRGEKIVSDLMNILNSNGVECDDVVVYKTVCKHFSKKIKLPKNSSIIFSSPSTIECFFKNCEWDESYKAISIGHTTEQYFPEYIKPIIADTTSLDACVRKAIELNQL